MSARRTVRPPRPESNTPIAPSFITETRCTPEPVADRGADPHLGRQHCEEDVEAARVGVAQQPVQRVRVLVDIGGNTDDDRFAREIVRQLRRDHPYTPPFVQLPRALLL